MKPVSISQPVRSVLWTNILLSLIGAIVVFRITVWKLNRSGETFFKEDSSNVMVALAIVALAAVWLGVKFIRREVLVKSGFELPILIFVGAVAASLMYTVEFSLTLRACLILVAQVALFYMLVDTLDSPSRIRWFLFFLLGCATVVAFYGVKEFFYLWTRPVIAADSSLAQTDHNLFYILLNRRVTSFLGWPNTLAGYLLLLWPVALLLPFWLKHWAWRVVAGLAAVTVTACILFTFSFLGWTSFFLATLILTPLFWDKIGVKSWTSRQKGILIAVVILFIGLFIWVIFRKNFLSSLTPRISYYKSAFALLTDHPLIGSGWETFGLLCRRFAETRNDLSTYVHNTYVQVWVEVGIAGFVGIVLFVVTFFRRMWSAVSKGIGGENRLFVLAVGWGLTSFFVDNLFSFTFIKPNIALHGWVMLAVFVALTRSGDVSAKRAAKGQGLVVLAMLVIAVCLVFLTRMSVAYAVYSNGFWARQAQVYDKAEKTFCRAEVWNPWDDHFPAAAGEINVRGYLLTREPAFLKQAEEKYLRAVKLSPNAFGNYFILSTIYERMGDREKAHQMAMTAKFLSPWEYDQNISYLDAQKKKSVPPSAAKP